MKNSLAGRGLCILFLGILSACRQTPEQLSPVRVGSPLAGLDENNQRRFQAGQVLFNRVFKPENGLGPLFNGDQCSACHTLPAAGGTGEQFVHRASRFSATKCDLLSSAGGENIRVMATELLQSRGIERQPFPEQATERTRFNVPFIFGLGLVEALPEEQIIRRADPDDANRDGISGRAGVDAQGRFSRFGRKADQPTLRSFIETAAHLEMGLTTPSRPHEGSVAGQPYPVGVDAATDPELSEAEVELLTDFVRFLSPPAQRKVQSDRTTIDTGEKLFHAVGCPACHTPSMTTGRHEVNALNHRRLSLYSDLLLHDLGPDLANVCAAGASPTEMRTEPLMGLGLRSLYLHDSRTKDLSEAIRFHGGEAAAAKARFQSLNELQQHQLIRFLQSL